MPVLEIAILLADTSSAFAYFLCWSFHRLILLYFI